MVDEFFDSDAIGKKSDPESYKKIIKLVKVQPSEVLYLTDTISGKMLEIVEGLN